jgi:predicted XRE-type DNA-binding protein
MVCALLISYTAVPPVSGRTTRKEGSMKEEAKLGQQVAQLANRMRVKQTQIAQNCEISRISVNRFFRGRSEIRASDLVNVLRVLGIDLEQEIQRRLDPTIAS